MKKIFNWTFGSVFRTFGRIIAYLIIGSLFGLIISKSGLKITDLFFEKIKADTFYNFNTGGFTGTDWSNSSLNNYVKRNYANNSTINHASTFVNQYSSSNITKIQINGYFKYLGFTNDSVMNCSSQQSNPFECYQWTIRENSNTFTFQIFLDNKATQCSIEWNNPNLLLTDYDGYVFWNATCYTHSIGQISYMIDYINSTYTNTHTLEFGISKTVQYFTSDNQAIIDNQNQNTQSVIQSQTNQTQTIVETTNQTQQTIINSANQTISTITDSTTPDLNGTLDNNTIAGWLPAGPIDSIVTLPLTLLNSLFNAMGGSCADLVVPLPFVNKNLNVPCMGGIYNSMGFTSFFNWIGVVASAFILYKYLLRLYKWIDDTLTLRENTQVDWGGD